MPDGGLVTTSTGLARLVDAFAGRSAGVAGNVGNHDLGTVRAQSANRYGYGLELGFAGGQLVVLEHNGPDPGVSAVVAHHLAAATTIIVVGNQDRGSWPIYLRLAASLGLSDPRA